MMLATARAAAIRATTVTAPRASVALGGRRCFSLGDALKKKESVEEERYIRKMEHDAYLQRKEKEDAHKAQMDKSSEEAETKAAMDSEIETLFGVLAKTGDKVSDMGIENIARWKLGKDE